MGKRERRKQSYEALIREHGNRRRVDMKLSQYAKKVGVTYKTAWRWWKESDLEQQVQRLRDFAAARGYQVAKEVIEIASGMNDQRPKFLKLLADHSIGTILVEHRDRATRFGWNYLTTLLEASGRRMEAIFPDETRDDLVNDFVSIITSMAARLYGKRGSKRRAERIKQCVEQIMTAPEEDEANASPS